MKKRKTKGSSMLLVIAIFGVLSIVGTAMLTATTASYKLMIEENNRVKGFYGAESGLDKAYIKLIDEVNEAVKKGQESSNQFSEKYREYIENELPDNVNGKYQLSNGEEADITCIVEPGEDNTEKATLESSFIEDGRMRVVKVTYSIEVPASYSDTDMTINTANAGKYSLATDGDLTINSTTAGSNLSLIGDIWVRGRRDSRMYDDPVNNKYKGGISVNNVNVSFENNVNTAANISFNNNTESSFGCEDGKNNVFAENILLGNVGNADADSKVILNGASSNMYLANDLVISSSDARASIQNLYAFNDARVQQNNKEIRGSSSIIVNSMNWPKETSTPSLVVSETAYIMGSAYIKTKEDDYQTGESVALKGNYVAYTAPADGEYAKSGYVYLNPLVLIDSVNGNELSVVDKAELFKEYSNGNSLRLRTQGIKLPANTANETRTFTLGAFISDNKVDKGTYSLDATDKVNELKRSFVESVYYMNDFNGETSEIDEQFNAGEPAFTVNNQINWDDIKTLIGDKNYYSGVVNNINLIINYAANYEGKEYDEIQKSGALVEINQNKITLKNLSGDDFVINIDSDKEYLIITNGSVNVNSLNNLNCRILAVGDITLQNCSGSIGSNNISQTIGSSGNSAIVAQELVTKEKWTLVK